MQKKPTEQRPRILVVDDHEFVRRTICTALAAAGFAVSEAADGDQIGGALRAGGADVVVVDIFMPGMDGMEVIRMLRRDHPSIRIIAISGGERSRELGYLEMARRLGADTTLAKPFAPSELVAAVSQLATSTGEQGT